MATAHSGPAHERRQSTDGISHAIDGDDLGGEKANVELGADGVEDRADQQGTEESLSHGAQGVNAVPLGGDHNVFALQKAFDLFHGRHLLYVESKNTGLQVS